MWFNKKVGAVYKETMFTLSDAGQPGTEIFNMPASTTAGKLFPPHQLLINIKVRGKPFMMHLLLRKCFSKALQWMYVEDKHNYNAYIHFNGTAW